MLIKAKKDFKAAKESYNHSWAAYSNPSHIESDQYYIVLAVYFSDMVSVHFHDSAFLPSHYPIELFDIIDPRPSRFWQLGHYTTDDGPPDFLSILSVPEWSLDYYNFWQNFVDGHGDTHEIINEYQEKMLLEFKRPDITTRAAPVEESWVECADCVNIWQPKTVDELVECPECGLLQINGLICDV